MMEFSDFINGCGLIDPPLEGGRYTWSNHEVVLVLFRIDRFLFSIEWEDHFHGVHQVTLPKIMSDHFPILLRKRTSYVAKCPFRFENVRLEVDGFSDFVKAVCNDCNISGSSSFVLAKKLNLLKSKLKFWNRDVFGHLETKLGNLVDKVKVLDAKEQLQSLSHAERL